MKGTFGYRIRELRQSFGMTQAEVSGELGVNRSTYCNWEKNIRRPDMESVAKLAELFGVTADFLVGRGGEDGQEGLKDGQAEEWKKWLRMWIQDKNSVIETMARNMAADLNAGYPYFGESIQKQRAQIESYRREYEEQLMKFAAMSDDETGRWCYFDLLRRGAITA